MVKLIQHQVLSWTILLKDLKEMEIRDLLNFLYIAKGSNGEVRSQSFRALDANFIDGLEQNEILRLTEVLKFKIQGLIQILKNSGGKGYK